MKHRQLTQLVGEDILAKVDPATLLVLRYFTSFSDPQLRQIVHDNPRLLLEPTYLKQLILTDAALSLTNGRMNSGDLSEIIRSGGVEGVVKYAAMKFLEDMPKEEKDRLKSTIDEHFVREVREEHTRRVIEMMGPVRVYSREAFIKRSIIAGLASLALGIGYTAYQLSGASHYIALGRQVAIAEEHTKEMASRDSPNQPVDLFTSRNKTYDHLVTQSQSLDTLCLDDNPLYEEERLVINEITPYVAVKGTRTTDVIDSLNPKIAKLKIMNLNELAHKAQGTVTEIRCNYDAAIQGIFYADHLGGLHKAIYRADTTFLQVRNNPEILGLDGLMWYVAALRYAAEMKSEYTPVDFVRNHMTELGEKAGDSILASDVFYVLGRLESKNKGVYDVVSGNYLAFDREPQFTEDLEKAKEYFKRSVDASVDPERYARASVCVAAMLDYGHGGRDIQEETRRYCVAALGTTHNPDLRSRALIVLGEISRLQGEYELANQLYDQTIRENNGVGSYVDEAKDRKFNVGLRRFVEGVF